MFEAISAECLFHEVLSLQEMGTWNLGIETNFLIFGVVNLNYSFSILGKTFFLKKIGFIFLSWWVSSLKESSPSMSGVTWLEHH
jgi:hypothetical protein